MTLRVHFRARMRSARLGLFVSLCAFAACREFENSGSLGSNSAASGASGESSGGESSGGEGGTEGGGQSGQGPSDTEGGAAGRGGGQGGEAGAQTEPEVPITAVPADYGAVRLLIGGKPVCAGTLHTNSWVLTADRCIPAGTAPADVTVGFGQDSRHFEQLRKGLEIQRYWDNDGTPEGRARDLLLLGVDAPFAIDGSTTGHHIPLMEIPAWTSSVCVGWDMKPDPESPTHRLHAMKPAPLDIEYRFAAELQWWGNSSAFEPMQGDLLMPADTGAGCFFNAGSSRWQATVHSETPAMLRDGAPNIGEQAYSTGLWEPAIHDWVESVLFEELPRTDFVLDGVAAVCSVDSESLELFSLTVDGRMGWRRFVGSEWVEQTPIDPPTGVALASTRPGVLCKPDGVIELVVTGAGTSGLWRRTWLPGEAAWNSDWSLVPDTNYAFPYGLSIALGSQTSFHLLAVSEWHDFLTRVCDQQGFGSWAIRWTDLREVPALAVPFPGVIDVFLRNASDTMLQMNYWGGWTSAWDPGFGASYANPALTSWGPNRRDLFAVRPAPTLHLVRLPYDNRWERWGDTFIEVPEGELNAVSRRPASVDVFISKPGDPLFHARWPRAPRAQ